MKTRNLFHRSSLACMALASCAGLLGASTALAADRTDGTRSLTVRYGDVNLATIAGATTLYQRIQGAAHFVCGEAGRSWPEQRDWKDCYRGAINAAVASVNNPLLSAVHRSRGGEGAVTAMLGR
jgi:UrcA family protein